MADHRRSDGFFTDSDQFAAAPGYSVGTGGHDGKLIGIVTDRDIRQAAPAYPLFRDEDEIRHYTEQLTVTAPMTADPMTIALDAPLVEAAKILETYRISCLPVVDEQRLVGALTVTDLLGVFANGTRTQAFAGEAEVRFETFNPACDRRVGPDAMNRAPVMLS